MRSLLLATITVAFMGAIALLVTRPVPAPSPYSGVPVATIGDVFRHH